MFVGWIRQDSFHDDLELFAQDKIIDRNLVTNTVMQYPLLCYGAYSEEKLHAFITAYEFDDSILINNFFYFDDIDKNILQRLITLMKKNLYESNKPIIVLSRDNEKEFFEQMEFKNYAPFNKAVYKGASKAFNFSNATAKSITNEHFLPYVKHMDQLTYSSDRSEYLMHTQFKSSSLLLSTPNAYQHSYAIAHNLIKISPWLNQDGAYDDAQKLIRGVIYHRGLKRIVAFVPADVKEIVELYESYGFEMVDELTLMYANQKPQLDIEKIYAL